MGIYIFQFSNNHTTILFNKNQQSVLKTSLWVEPFDSFGWLSSLTRSRFRISSNLWYSSLWQWSSVWYLIFFNSHLTTWLSNPKKVLKSTFDVLSGFVPSDYPRLRNSSINWYQKDTTVRTSLRTSRWTFRWFNIHLIFWIRSITDAREYINLIVLRDNSFQFTFIRFI